MHVFTNHFIIANLRLADLVYGLSLSPNVVASFDY